MSETWTSASFDEDGVEAAVAERQATGPGLDELDPVPQSLLRGVPARRLYHRLLDIDSRDFCSAVTLDKMKRDAARAASDIENVQPGKLAASQNPIDLRRPARREIALAPKLFQETNGDIVIFGSCRFHASNLAAMNHSQSLADKYESTSLLVEHSFNILISTAYRQISLFRFGRNGGGGPANGRMIGMKSREMPHKTGTELSKDRDRLAGPHIKAGAPTGNAARRFATTLPSEEDVHWELIRTPLGEEWSGRTRYAAAMYLYRKGEMNAEVLEVYRACARLDSEDPLAIVRDRTTDTEWLEKLRRRTNTAETCNNGCQ